MLYKRVLWSYFAGNIFTSGATTYQLGTAPIVPNTAFRVVVTAGRFGIVELSLPSAQSMPAGYAEKDGVVSNGVIFVNDAVVCVNVLLLL